MRQGLQRIVNHDETAFCQALAATGECTNWDVGVPDSDSGFENMWLGVSQIDGIPTGSGTRL